MSRSLPILTAAVPPPSPPEATRDGRLYDSHGRVIRDVRLSVTDRCNYRCVYCMDPDHKYLPKRDLLSADEYLTIARVCVSLGIGHIRVTGGEPTLYPHLETLLDEIGRLPLDDLAMTTNGSLLTEARAARWHASGLTRLTFSLDSLRPERVAAITRTKATADGVRNAIRTARRAGLDPLKVNAVVMRDVNDDEVADFADFAREEAIDMRLIEWMPLDSGHRWRPRDVVSADEMLEAIRTRHDLVELPRKTPHDTALHFAFADGAPGRIGIIASVTRPFCGACSRLRVTADGKVRPCLFSHDEWDLRPLLKAKAEDETIASFLADAMWTKQAGHAIGQQDFVQPARGMSAIGG